MNQISDPLYDELTDNFLEFASYVIKDRAIPDVDDGLKPVQRRIMHTLDKVHDGRFHKVANIVGTCMQFHPHGDSSIYGALVNIATKNFFISKQGNFGNIITGDNASAARYIECRLSPLALDVLYSKEVTQFIDSYDGRSKEPVALPCKVPALLMQGTEGIAVGMATKIFPHNFKELLLAQIDILNGKSVRLVPDFPQGGLIDARDYEDGLGKIIARAKIETLNNKTLVIREVTPTTTTESLITSIENAVKKGKVKLSSISDFTTEEVEIELKIARGASAQQCIDALYAFTDCEISLSSNPTVICNKTPSVMSVPAILHHNTQRLVDILRQELEIKKLNLEAKIHSACLEQLFIEEGIYKKIEDCKTNEEVHAAIYRGFEPFAKDLSRNIEEDDIERLLKIPIRRISFFDVDYSRKTIDKLHEELKKVINQLADMKGFSINFIRNLIKKYSSEYERRTDIGFIQKVDAKNASMSNTKVGIDIGKGYFGLDIKSDNTITCSEFDRIISISKDGSYTVTDIPTKEFRQNLKYIFVANKKKVFRILYEDNKTGAMYGKKIKFKSYILNRKYNLCPEGCTIRLIEEKSGTCLQATLVDTSRSKGQTIDINMLELPEKGTHARGSKLTPRKVKSIKTIVRGSHNEDKEQTAANDQAIEDNSESFIEEEKIKLEPLRFARPETISIDDKESKPEPVATLVAKELARLNSPKPNSTDIPSDTLKSFEKNQIDDNREEKAEDMDEDDLNVGEGEEGKASDSIINQAHKDDFNSEDEPTEIKFCAKKVSEITLSTRMKSK